ncbi:MULTISPECIES: DNA mismatch repair endonuclease MutH [Providencia]|uniref:DNA mismatch repair endonuclease MutH n=1 Tax=Providencia TaxID=586 RepID=UPI0019CFEE93|nr:MULTISPECIES: DNA mismatch repair endonuclease MutH [Providencia]MBN6362706.1 DNA mismatch repair endonuclease MutH [Providencia huaxiensis]
MTPFIAPPPPDNEATLMARAQALAGYTLGQLAQHAAIPIPPDLKRDKGWVGMLLEYYLGASAGSKAEQDFAHIGIELKTIPIDRHGAPLETTFVSVAPLTGNSGLTWENSHVRRKLSRILWFPIEGERQIPLSQRRVANPLIWSPSPLEEQLLRQDWEELMDLIVLGKVESITARHGQVLQIRPKAANNKALTEAIGEFGQPIMTLPRGFYLKKDFTGPLLARHFSLS